MTRRRFLAASISFAIATMSAVALRAQTDMSTGTRVVAPDGKSLTVSSEGINAAGQPIKSVLVFDKR